MKSNITKSDLIRESCTNELENCRVKSLSGEPHTNYFLFDYLSECRRNRAEAVKLFAEKVRPKFPVSPEGKGISEQITQALAELEGKGKIE